VDGIAIAEVSGCVVALMYLLRWVGIRRRWAILLVPSLSAVGVAVWAYANGTFDATGAFGYLAGWVAVTTSAATVWGFSWAAVTRSGVRRPGKSRIQTGAARQRG
jgi:hypothetical protein